MSDYRWSAGEWQEGCWELQCSTTGNCDKCIELLPCDWLISNLCYQAIEQVYIIKWLVSVYIYIYIYIYRCISIN